MNARVCCGTFDAEAVWREADLAKLPSVGDSVSTKIVQAMDEMQFVFCRSNDLLLTNRRMNDAHIAYLRSVGFHFTPSDFDLFVEDDGASNTVAATASDIFARMLGHVGSRKVAEFLPRGTRLDPFAVLPGASDVVERFGLDGLFPTPDVVRTVNTKSYSLQMRDRVGLVNVGVVVDSVASFLAEGKKLLERGQLLVKDDYGVSGKGNLLVGSLRMLESIASYLMSQVSRGTRVRLVLEPYLQKVKDFSCQFNIDPNGSVEVISVQELENNGQAFGMSRTPSPELRQSLDAHGYLQLMTEVGRRMHGDGYFGHVCVDSMVLKDGIFPLVEINARKSMSLIKNALDQHLARDGLKGALVCLSALNDGSLDYAGLLGLMDKEQVLYTRQNQEGILPLTCGTMYHSSSAPKSPTRGRLYVAAVAETVEQQRVVLSRLQRVLIDGGIRL